MTAPRKKPATPRKRAAARPSQRRTRGNAPRPSKLDPHRMLLLEWAQAGLSGRQIATRLAEREGVSVAHTTVNEWMARPENVAALERVRREQLQALQRQTISAGSPVMARLLQIVTNPDARDQDAIAAGGLVLRAIGMDKALELMEAQGDLVASAVRETVVAKIESMRTRVVPPELSVVVDAEATEVAS